jgi:hypothetical protein
VLSVFASRIKLVTEKGLTVYVLLVVKVITGLVNVRFLNSGISPTEGLGVDALDSKLEELLFKKVPTAFANGLELPV